MEAKTPDEHVHNLEAKTPDEHVPLGGHAPIFRARWCLRGDMQRKGFDFDETFSPTIKQRSVRFLAALAAHTGLPMRGFDFKGAYLNAKAERESYIRVPDRYTDGKPEYCSLLLNLYGGCDAGRTWHLLLANTMMKDEGYARCAADPCVFIKSVGNQPAVVGVYNDDGISVALPTVSDRFLERIGAKFPLVDLGVLNNFMGVRVRQNPEQHRVALDQEDYVVNTLLPTVGMSDCNPAPTPAQAGLQLTREQSPQSEEEKAARSFTTQLYQMACGQLVWMGFTRPDIAFIVHMLCRFISNPGEPHWRALKRLCRYLKPSSHLGLVYEGRPIFRAMGYTDADYANDLEHRRSYSGWVIMLSGAPVAWGVQVQRSVATSTTDAEYFALAAAVKELLWWIDFMAETHTLGERPLLLNDNQAAIAMAHSENGATSRTKHIAVRMHFVRDVIMQGFIELAHCPSPHMLADIFTKLLGKGLFQTIAMQLVAAP